MGVMDHEWWLGVTSPSSFAIRARIDKALNDHLACEVKTMALIDLDRHTVFSFFLLATSALANVKLLTTSIMLIHMLATVDMDSIKKSCTDQI